MAKPYRIRVRGKQREDLDIDLLAQALLMIVEDVQTEQGKQKNEDQGQAESSETK